MKPLTPYQENLARKRALYGSSADYVSGGRNQNCEPTCSTCRFRNPDLKYSGWGWRSLRNCASVAPTGGCDKHEKDTLPHEPGMSDAEMDAIEREKLAAARGIIYAVLPSLVLWAGIIGAGVIGYLAAKYGWLR
jgi:hypothetical protein